MRVIAVRVTPKNERISRTSILIIVKLYNIARDQTPRTDGQNMCVKYSKNRITSICFFSAMRQIFIEVK
jgi:hypothetical protein